MAASAMSFTKLVTPLAGCQPIGETSTTKRHPLGTVVRAVDDTYGESEFIYAKGVASTALGDFAVIDNYNGTTARAVHTSAARGKLGVAMSANVANQYGWYMIGGSALVNAATSAAAGAAVYLTGTAGTVDDGVVSGDKVDNAIFTVSEGSSNAGTGVAVVQLWRPGCTGNG